MLGAATIKGLEAELSIRPTEGLTLSGNLTWLDPTFDSFCELVLPAGNTIANGNPACIDAFGRAGFQRAGNRLPNASEWQASLALGYVAPIGKDGQFRFSASYSYFSNQSYLPSGEIGLSSGNVGLLNGRIGLSLAENGPELYVYGKNITDKRYIDYGVRGSANLGPAHSSDPRTFGIGLKYRF
jgi:iron complex outermembrane receptor protein